jgi:CheY-like chemotaxis protein
MGKQNQTILLADDDHDDLELLSEVISGIDEDYKIVQVNNGIQALKKLKELKLQGNLPCLIVLDINMPRMDGKQTLLAVKSDPDFSNIPVVIFSTSNSELDKLYFKKKNVEMITKPVEFQALYNAAEKMLDYCED